MAAPKQFSPSMLTLNKTVLVRGNLGYNNLTRPYTGDELERRNKEAQLRGLNGYSPNAHEVVDVTIHNPQVIPANPTQMTLEEAYVNERFYQSAKNGLSYGITRTNSGVPAIGVMTDGVHATEIVPPEGYVTGNPVVTLVVRTFSTKAGRNGMTLDAVIFNEEPSFASGGNRVKSQLEEHGIIWTSLPTELESAGAMEVPTPAAIPAPPVVQAAPAMPAQPIQAAVPVTPAMPTPQQAYVPPANIPPQVMEAASQAASPYEAPVATQPKPGIRYDAM